MKKIKKAIKLFALVCLIILASLGLGIVGGIPIPFSDKRKQSSDIKIELVESIEEESDVKEFDSKI